jgi:hypothetical protein
MKDWGVAVIAVGIVVVTAVAFAWDWWRSRYDSD